MNHIRLVRQQRHQHRLGFDPQDAVRWLAPRELARAGVKAVLSAVFADYADKREIQAGLEQGLIEIPTALPDSTEDCWFDYAADVGDGFDATYTIASLLAEESLTPAGTDTSLPRGSMLVLGGDEVYPTASAGAYEDRMIGPYRAAFPNATTQPILLALPGNHDWYDGLTSFLRTFTLGRSIGGWKTVQTRSYFAVQLPHRWWLVGLDSQFESYIDEPQLKYFENHIASDLKPGDGVILCSASPTWLKTDRDPDAFNSLFWFEKNYIRARRVGNTEKREPTGAEVRLWLTGDSHHYARYIEKLDDDVALPNGAARQMVTCGLGGAYLSATHHLRKDFRILPELSRSYREGDEYTDFLRGEISFPNAKDSRSLTFGLAKPWRSSFLLWRNPGLLPLFAVVHTILFLALFLRFAHGSFSAQTGGHGPAVASFLEATPGTIWAFAFKVLVVCLIGALAIWVLPMVRFRHPTVRLSILATVLAQVGVLLGVFVGLGHLMGILNVNNLPDILIITALLILAALLGGLVGGLVFGVSIVCYREGEPLTWQMSGQAIEDHKGFLRLRISPTGVTVFPMVVDDVNRDWAITRFQTPTDSATGGVGPPIQVPRAANRLPTPRLIEEPFHIARTSGK
ncbi:hypothetical protein [Rhodococcus koreensis]